MTMTSAKLVSRFSRVLKVSVSKNAVVNYRTRVARWFVFKPKIPIWINFGGPKNGKCWYTYCMVIWNILRSFGIFYGHLVMLW
jgi:hypothetical protein